MLSMGFSLCMLSYVYKISVVYSMYLCVIYVGEICVGQFILY
jgi:hypothetical protein